MSMCSFMRSNISIRSYSDLETLHLSKLCLLPLDLVDWVRSFRLEIIFLKSESHCCTFLKVLILWVRPVFHFLENCSLPCPWWSKLSKPFTLVEWQLFHKEKDWSSPHTSPHTQYSSMNKSMVDVMLCDFQGWVVQGLRLAPAHLEGSNLPCQSGPIYTIRSSQHCLLSPAFQHLCSEGVTWVLQACPSASWLPMSDFRWRHVEPCQIPAWVCQVYRSFF
jgi:hypothetical protein